MRQLWLYGLICAALVISCYQGHGLNPTAGGDSGTGIRGTITFQGTWPDSTKEVRVAVLRQYPHGITDNDSLMAFVITNLVANSDTIPRGSETYDFAMQLEPDVYAWVIVAWFPDIPLYFFGVKELGAFYRDPDDMEIPTPVNVVQGIMTEGVDIIADFENLKNDRAFFKRRMP